MIKPVAELDYRQIIALSEDPNVSGEDVRGRPFGAGQYAELADFADSVFYRCSVDEQVEITRCLPAHVSVRRLANMTDPERIGILSRLPSDLADDIISLLAVGVS